MYQNKKGAEKIVTGKNKRKTGAIFEAKAVQFLESQGYQIVETNYRCRFGEIDIVAWDGKEAGQTLVFAEVKYRSSLRFGSPFEAVDEKKQSVIKKTAQFYIKEHKIPANMNVRYDVVGILGQKISLIKNAFGSM